MSETAAPGADAGTEPEGGAQQFNLQRIYVKDISFENPNAPEVFRKAWNPKIKLDLNTRFQQLEDAVYEVVLTLSIEAKAEDDATGFIVEMQQAGIFRISGFETAQLQQMLASYCPNVLFPYARETIDNLVLRGSFPPLMLAPVNFDALYAEALKRQAEQGGDAPGDGVPH